jgi:type IV pilus assembly protein PilB
VDVCLTKPVNPAEFTALVRQILGGPACREPISSDIKDHNSPIVRIAHTIIQQAIIDEASELQVLPRPDGVAVRFRLPAGLPRENAGELHEVMKLPKHLERNLIARYKLMSDMEIEPEGVPQTGRIAITHAGRDYDFEVRCRPTPEGEQIVMEIHPVSAAAADSTPSWPQPP